MPHFHSATPASPRTGRMQETSSEPDHAWFLPKRYGYGTGAPITWQGWALTVGFIGAQVAIHMAFNKYAHGNHLAEATSMIILTVLLCLVAKAKTRGGWRWRWGSGKQD